MKRLLATIAAAAITTPAFAADMPSYEAETISTPMYDWSGFYVGVHGGYGRGSLDMELPPGALVPLDLDPEGVFGGLQAGYTYVFANNIVAGLEADLSFGDIGDDRLQTTTILGFTETVSAASDIEAMGSVRGRLGYAAGKFLPYITGGLAWARHSFEYNYSFLVVGADVDDTQTHFGWTLGAGLEAAVSERLRLKVEYAYSDFDEETYQGALTGGATPIFVDAEFDLHTVKAGLNYRF